MNNKQNRSDHRIYDWIRSRIDAGVWSPGEKLPSTRALAADLGVSRSTVVVIYEQLAAEGYIKTAVGARARVSNGLQTRQVPPHAMRQAPKQTRTLSAYGERMGALAFAQRPVSDPHQINFLYGAIAEEDFPTLAWRRLYNRALVDKQHLLYYGASEGEASLREALQSYLMRARGLQCTSDQILIVQGTQQALDLCAKVLVDPGDPVVMEEPCYLMARRTFESIGAKIMATPVDEQGLDSSALPSTPCTLAYVTPSHQFPLGSVMSISRRQALLAWAQRQSSWIIEDDYDSEFRYGLRPVDPLQSLDTHACVIYIGTFSKALSPQLRLGYLVLPPALVTPFRQAKQLADRHSPMLEQAILAELIRSGAYERHVRRLKRENDRRRSALLQAISAHLGLRARVEGADSGLHVVVWFKDIPMDSEHEVVAKAKESGVGIWPVSPLFAEGSKFRKARCAGFVLGYASLKKSAIDKGIGLLADVMQPYFAKAAPLQN
ncbi:PLP-dependent aminotransferase family protein [Limnohabitans sp.]|uniref:MocR-like pyridoxine biosynthesis transcription factor PdxR n=1 Tax=Limnohabitans sp. TaxID=1907725 RepID=UPI0037BE6B67